MNSPTYEEMERNREETNKELNEAFRHYFYVRNRNVLLTPEAMDALECSIQKHMAKFKVEFESNDEKIHITLPKIQDGEACIGHIRIAQELRTALDVTGISTFFLIDKARCYESHIQDMKRILLQTQKRQQKRGGLEADIKQQQEILSIFEVALNEILESPQG
ncbi:hypothetical protein FPHYL_2582 [Fusarium phyllophilum]|uniref:Uncharacterized protein n=1 Tax=Fusarium phyllophilum TaxID=47803 RepID=A0A8H5NJE6_9HYPO|nr:hypothetical protein FPHYL_2582 [Fusarium phyllophilum]